MTNKPFAKQAKQDKYVFFGILAVLLIVSGIIFYPAVYAYIGSKLDHRLNDKGDAFMLELAKTPKDYYNMFQCSCCGRPIDTGCCGMAIQRKQHVDELLLEGLEDKEVVYEMVKKFGFDVLMDQSMEQEVRDYVKSKASANPPELTLDKDYYNFGTIKQTEDVISTDFVIRNTGKSDLVIENLDTSCMCTSALLIYKGKESPIFSMSMHGENPKDFELSIPSGESAILRVLYDPMAHGKQKKQEMKITREVTIISNDPINFQEKVKIELNQVL